MAMWRDNAQPEVPPWASPLDAGQFAAFRDDLAAALAPLDGRDSGEGWVTVPGSTTRYGLTNLAQQWAQADPGDRAELVGEHLARLVAIDEDALPRGEQLLSALRPRLWSATDAEAVELPLLTRPVADGIVAVLSVDLPTHVANLRPQDAQATGLSLDALWDRALAQVDDGLEVQTQSVPVGFDATLGDSFFVASRLLDLPRFVPGLPAAGALVAAPHRHALLVHPVVSVAALPALNAMVGLAASMYGQGPGSIVPFVYWWRDGQPLLRIDVALDGDTIAITPPDELVELLNRLG